MCTEEKKKLAEMMNDLKGKMCSNSSSREELADWLSEKLGVRVTVSTIDAWFKESRPDMFPSFLAILYICVFVRSFAPLNNVLNGFSHHVITRDEFRLMKIGGKWEEFRGFLREDGSSMKEALHKKTFESHP